jgi:DNA-nicking Smr family endonuclease
MLPSAVFSLKRRRVAELQKSALVTDKGKRLSDWSQLSKLVPAPRKAPPVAGAPAPGKPEPTAGYSPQNPKTVPKSGPVPQPAAELDGEALFSKAMHDVQPLKRGPERRQRHAPRPEGPGGNPATDLFTSGKWDLVPTLQGDYIEAAHASVSQLTLRKLRRGDFRVQAECDLHGLSQETAKAEVFRFVQDSSMRQFGCVRIIHGRGNNSAGHQPIIKTRLQEWLCARRPARYVLAYCSALPRDGGTGAVYVLLRKG